MKLTDIIHYTKPLNRTGMFSNWKARICDIEVSGKSQEEVTSKVIQETKEALTESYEPVLIFDGSYYACCWRETYGGWRYAIRPIGKGISTGSWCQLGTSKDECVNAATNHLRDYVADSMQ